jgi:hypothetical protein
MRKMLPQTIVDEINVNVTSKTIKAPAGKRARKWACQISESYIGEYQIIPLTSIKMVKSEAYLMSNCCRDYAFLCAAEEYCLFSIRSWSGERLGTLGLINDQGYWRYDQCYGQSNSNVLEESFEYLDEEGVLQIEYFPNELYYVVHDVVRLMNSSASH